VPTRAEENGDADADEFSDRVHASTAEMAEMAETPVTADTAFLALEQNIKNA
jgi:hypothetical protein